MNLEFLPAFVNRLEGFVELIAEDKPSAARKFHKEIITDELNDAISLLLDKYNNKIVKRFNKSRFEMFLELDKPFLQSLPNEKYVYREFKEATVSQSYHIFLEEMLITNPISKVFTLPEKILEDLLYGDILKISRGVL